MGNLENVETDSPLEVEVEETHALGVNIDDKEELWNTVGFHRITGGFFYGYVLLIGGALVGLFTLPLITNFLPFPEINGYRSMVATLLGVWFGLMDFNMGGGGGLSDGISRFIGQYSDTDPRRALKYIQFYVWFQMWSGLLQVTLIAVVCFGYLVHNVSYSFMIYFIIAESMVQYPGMLMIMEACLKSFQRGDKLAWLSWLQDTVFQVTVNITFLIIGKNWGEAHPEIGALMGITIFYIISQYADDWINLFIGGYMFNKVLKERGIEVGVWAIIFPGFDKPVVKEALLFTGKQWIGSQITAFINWAITLYAFVELFGYASWQGLLLIPNFIGHLTSMAGPMGSQAVPAISEAYNNGKEELARYFISDLLKWFSFITFFLAISLAMVTPKILGVVVGAFPNLENYEMGIVLIPLVMIIEGTNPYRGLWSKIFIACNRPVPPIIIGWIVTPLDWGLKILFLYLIVDAQVLPGIYFILMPGFLSSLIGTVIGYIWIQKKVLKIHYGKIFWQAFGAPIASGIVYGIVLYLFSLTFWPLLDAAFTPLGNWAVSTFNIEGVSGVTAAKVLVAVLILLSCIFVFPALFFAPLYALFGGFDDFTLEEFRKTALVSGPSKFLVMGMYKLTRKFSYRSKWVNNHPIADYQLVEQQLIELIKEGKANAILKSK